VEFESSGEIFGKYSNINFHWSLFSGNRVVSCGQRDGRTDMTKQIVAFHNSAKATKKRGEEKLR